MGWKEGLFAIKCPLCLFNYCCSECALAQIHEKLGNPMCGKAVACILAFCIGNIQIMYYGMEGKKGEESALCAFLKCNCCGACYLHQQYKEHGCVEDLGGMIMTSFKPSQAEMS